MTTKCSATRIRRSAAAYLLVLMAAVGWFHGASATAPRPVAPVAQAAAPAAGEKSMTIALTGDSIITMKLSVYTEPQFVKMIELIRGADAAFTNLEVLFHDYEPYPMTQSGGTYMRADPALARELVWAGFDLVARANNHTSDYGVEGMRLTTQVRRRSGAGATPASARAFAKRARRGFSKPIRGVSH